jgi:hypothetical protein
MRAPLRRVIHSRESIHRKAESRWRLAHHGGGFVAVGSRLLFPELSLPTAPVIPAASSRPATTNTGLTMPQRKTTRAQALAQRIDDERRQNAAASPPF